MRIFPKCKYHLQIQGLNDIWEIVDLKCILLSSPVLYLLKQHRDEPNTIQVLYMSNRKEWHPDCVINSNTKDLTLLRGVRNTPNVMSCIAHCTIIQFLVRNPNNANVAAKRQELEWWHKMFGLHGKCVGIAHVTQADTMPTSVSRESCS